MATTRLMPLHIGKGRTVGTAIQAIIDYVENPEKTDYGKRFILSNCRKSREPSKVRSGIYFTVTEHMDFLILVALTLNSAFALL